MVISSGVASERDTERVTELPPRGATYAVPRAQLGLLRRGERLVARVGCRVLEADAPVSRETVSHAGSVATSLTVVALSRRPDKLRLGVPCNG